MAVQKKFLTDNEGKYLLKCREEIIPKISSIENIKAVWKSYAKHNPKKEGE